MNPVLFILIFLTSSVCSAKINAQTQVEKSAVLSDKEVLAIFTEPVKKELKITWPIFRVYKYTDKTGEFYTALTESRDSVGKRKDTFNVNIRAINFRSVKGKLTKTWEFSDFKMKGKKNELSIWFWTKYSEFKDHDGDAVTDPIIIYGTNTANGFDDARIKIIIFHKGQKIVLSHQNGISDAEREIQIDKAFYSLPRKLQDAVKEKMELMVKKYQAIFPNGWQKAMLDKKTKIS